MCRAFTSESVLLLLQIGEWQQAFSTMSCMRRTYATTSRRPVIVACPSSTPKDGAHE